MSRSLAAAAAVPLALLLAGPPAASAQAEKADPHRLPGYVDGAEFAKLAHEDSGLIQVSVHGPLLRAIASGFSSSEPDLSKLLGGLESVSAVVADASDRAKALKTIQETAGRLEEWGWERIAFVRNEGEHVNVYIRSDEKVIDGLVVMVLDKKGKAVFANIAGVIDLAKIASIGNAMDIPGLDRIPKGVGGNAPSPAPAGEPPTGEPREAPPAPGKSAGSR